jgi:hypothetical protein
MDVNRVCLLGEYKIQSDEISIPVDYIINVKDNEAKFDAHSEILTF